jgi:type II secretory ATPase GspE/PulE/Tfp pilus assembly ATPase PilB-like protein
VWKFDNALRAIFRQDPDIVMVGEIRDLETAAIAIKAALTGHMVFSTVHTNDAASSFIRLVDIGVKPFMVASGVRCVLAQRLVRTLCTTCKEPAKPDELQKERLGLKVNFDDIELFEGKGCEHCNHTGYQGRIGIYELLVTTDKLRELIINGASAGALRAEARASGGMKTLREDAWQKAVAGITSVQEVLRVTQMDEPV